VVFLRAKLDDFALEIFSQRALREISKVSPLCGEYAMTNFRTKDDRHGPVVNTVACTVKVKVPNSFAAMLNDLRERCVAAASYMLAHREESSSRYYPEIPCAVAKSLITKYQNNQKCKQVSNIVIPICGDKGRQIKYTGNGLRIPVLFQKQLLPVVWMRRIARSYDEKRKIWYWAIRSVEFIQRKGEWYACITYNTPAQPMTAQPTGLIGVDRNSVGAVVTLADPQTGKVMHMGFNPARTKEVWGRTKANLQSLGKKRVLHKVLNKQSRCTSMRITSCPNRLWTTPQNIVGQLSSRNWKA